MDSLSSAPDSEDLFRITASREITALLRVIEKNKPLIRMHDKHSKTAIITTLLELDTDNDEIIVDSAPDNDLNNRLTALNEIFFETSLERVHVKFTTTKITPCVYDNQPALRMAIPAEVTRIQRRDFFRITTPVITPVLCVIPRPKGSQPATASLPLDDISGGGIAIFDDSQLLDHTKGAAYNDCSIELPGVGIITVNLRLAHAETVNLANEKIRYRLGCSFVAPSGATLNLVQRYVAGLERELIAKKRGF